MLLRRFGSVSKVGSMCRLHGRSCVRFVSGHMVRAMSGFVEYHLPRRLGLDSVPLVSHLVLASLHDHHVVQVRGKAQFVQGADDQRGFVSAWPILPNRSAILTLLRGPSVPRFRHHPDLDTAARRSRLRDGRSPGPSAGRGSGNTRTSKRPPYDPGDFRRDCSKPGVRAYPEILPTSSPQPSGVAERALPYSRSSRCPVQ